jgi:hypothetical protein
MHVLSETAQALGSAEGNTEFRVFASDARRPGVEGHDRATHYANEATSEIPVVLVRRENQPCGSKSHLPHPMLRTVNCMRNL